MKRLNSLLFSLALAFFACSGNGKDEQDFSDLQEGDIEQFLYQDVHYKIVRIGSQIWFAENLSAEPSKGNSWCYGNIPPIYCDYGRLYDWKGANNVCPSGWRLPSKKDYNALLDYVDSNSQYLAGHVLKSSRGWSYGGGPDIYNFSVLPAGYRFSDDLFLGRGEQTFFWLSLEGCPYYVRFYKGDGKLHFGPDEETKGFSVRCVKK